MKRFPTVESLASASLDEVNAVWAGLGYYRRAKLIHECAKAIVANHDGKIPGTAAELEKLPGLGRYTAGAIASVVFGEVAPIVDGNVVRVLTRFRAIAGDSKSPKVIKALWELSTACVSPERPGDFNQALMELGALVCTKANPACPTCPLSTQCLALAETKSENWKAHEMEDKAMCADWNVDIEELCHWCPSTTTRTAMTVQTSIGNSVAKYPMKGAKKAKKQLTTSVSIVRWRRTGDADDAKTATEEEFWYLFKRRPEGGLLGGFWEFPSLDEAMKEENHVKTEEEQEEDEEEKEKLLNREAMDEFLKTAFGLGLEPNVDQVKRQSLGTYLHKFTHIDQTVLIEKVDVFGCKLPSIFQCDTLKWVSGDKISELAISKVTSVCIDRVQQSSALSSAKSSKPKKPSTSPSPKKKSSLINTDKKQPSILSMFAASKGGKGKPKEEKETAVKEE